MGMIAHVKELLSVQVVIAAALTLGLSACGPSYEELPTAQFVSAEEGPGPQYIIGPGDAFSIFVWRNPELSTSVTVRPDGRITVPLIEDLPATGRTPTQLARDVESQLKVYIQDPIVSIIMAGFAGPFAQQVRVVGEADSPKAIPFRANMTLLDLVIATGGLTEFAAGNRAVLVRFQDGKQTEYSVRLDDLIKDGDISANILVMPGDVLIIPESWF